MPMQIGNIGYWIQELEKVKTITETFDIEIKIKELKDWKEIPTDHQIVSVDFLPGMGAIVIRSKKETRTYEP